MIHINIEINKPNGFKKFLHNLHSKSEDILFSIFTKLPDRLIPSSLMTWMERYADKRLQELQQEIIRSRWNVVELEKAVENIHHRQQD